MDRRATRSLQSLPRKTDSLSWLRSSIVSHIIKTCSMSLVGLTQARPASQTRFQSLRPSDPNGRGGSGGWKAIGIGTRVMADGNFLFPGLPSFLLISLGFGGFGIYNHFRKVMRFTCYSVDRHNSGSFLPAAANHVSIYWIYFYQGCNHSK